MGNQGTGEVPNLPGAQIPLEVPSEPCSSSNTKAVSAEGWVCISLLAYLYILYIFAGIFEEWHLLGFFWEIYACSGLGSLWDSGQEARGVPGQTEHPLCSISPCSALCSSARLQCQTKYMCGEAAGAKAAGGEQQLAISVLRGWVDWLCCRGNPGPGDRGGRSLHRLPSSQKNERDFYALWRLFSCFGKSFYFMCLCKCFITWVLWVLWVIAQKLMVNFDHVQIVPSSPEDSSLRLWCIFFTAFKWVILYKFWVLAGLQ